MTIAVDAGSVFISFSRLLGAAVIDAAGGRAGRVWDLLVAPGRVYPESSAFVVRRGRLGRRLAVIEWAAVESVDAAAREVRLSLDGPAIARAPSQDDRRRMSLRGDVLDRQVVDIQDHRVVRVNDVNLLAAGDLLMLAHVDVGARGVIRRLGYEPVVDACVRLLNPRSAYLSRERLISWKHVQPLPTDAASSTIRLDIPRKQLARIPAADLGEIFLDLGINQQLPVFKSMDLATRVKLITHVDARTQRALLEGLDEREAAALLQAMPSDEGADLLEQLPKPAVERLLGIIETRHSRKLSLLLGYSSDSAGGMMVAEYLAFARETTVEQALARIREGTGAADPAPFVGILDADGRLVGVTTVRRLLAADPKAHLTAAAHARFHHVHPSSSLREVAYMMEKYRLFVIPVVDDRMVLLGIITMDDVLERVIPIAWRRAIRRRGGALL